MSAPPKTPHNPLSSHQWIDIKWHTLLNLVLTLQDKILMRWQQHLDTLGIEAGSHIALLPSFGELIHHVWWICPPASLIGHQGPQETGDYLVQLPSPETNTNKPKALSSWNAEPLFTEFKFHLTKKTHFKLIFSQNTLVLHKCTQKVVF